MAHIFNIQQEEDGTFSLLGRPLHARIGYVEQTDGSMKPVPNTSVLEPYVIKTGITDARTAGIASDVYWRTSCRIDGGLYSSVTIDFEAIRKANPYKGVDYDMIVNDELFMAEFTKLIPYDLDYLSDQDDDFDIKDFFRPRRVAVKHTEAGMERQAVRDAVYKVIHREGGTKEDCKAVIGAFEGDFTIDQIERLRMSNPQMNDILWEIKQEASMLLATARHNDNS
ncbi:hypothetical protein AB4304_13905 [Vibrio breoganii]